MVWAGWLYSQEWWRQELWKARSPAPNTLEQEIESRRRTFFANSDANDLILQARTWQRHDVGTTPGFGGEARARAHVRSPCRCSTCCRRPTSISRSATPGSKPRSFRAPLWCRFPRCGAIPQVPAAIPEIGHSSTRRSACFSPVPRPSDARSYLTNVPVGDGL